jgi:uncharacterized protein (TIGR02466 family)
LNIIQNQRSTNSKMSDAIQHNIFPILVQQIPGFINSSQATAIANHLKSHSHTTHGALTGNAHSTFSSNINALNSVELFVPVKNRLQEYCNNFSSAMGIRNVEIANSWSNIQHPGSKLEFHAHPFSVISGVLYIRADDDSSPISFKNPNPYIDMLDRKDGFTPYTATTYTITPKTGDLLIWAGWLQHGSDVVNRSNERIVVSFNSKFA